MSRRAAALAALLLLPSLDASAAERRSLSIEERIDARRAIEKVLYEHRTWPEGTPYPKPSFEEWLPAGALEREIEDDLRKTDALAKRWGHPVEPAALQAELDRMLRDSKAPDVLAEILDALGNDATLAAEVLARHTVVDRLARSAFAYDARIHGETYERAAAARDRVFDIAALRGAADRYVDLRYERARDVKTLSPALGAGIVERVDEATWREVVEPLRARPLGEMGPLEESEHEFTVTAVTARGPGSLSVSTAVWPKRSFDDWWEAERGAFSADEPIAAPDSGYTIGVLTAPGNPCTNDTWYPLNRVVPGARMEAVSVWTGSEMIVWGGGAGMTGALATGGRYRPDIDVWIEINTANAPAARRRATAVWTGTEMIVWGGDDGGSPTLTAFNSGGRYNPATDAWTATDTSTAPEARRYAASVWTGSTMIVWGGSTAFSGRLGTGGIYNPASNSWTATPTTNAPSARYGHTATWFNGEMIVWGGDAGNLESSGARYSPASNQWTATSLSGVPGPRAWHSAVVMGGRILIWGGQRTATNTWNTGAYYQSNHSWFAITSTNAPTGRMNHVAEVVYDPSLGDRRMVVFGGQDNFNGGITYYDVGDGRVYRELQGDWVAMNLAGAPSFRRLAASVSTGTRLVVWGGAAGTSALGDGRQFDAFNNVWSGVSDTGTAGPAPGARALHTLVSTGSELVVWGGQTTPGVYAVGGSSYSPATDSWSAIPTAGSPSQVSQHTAVWTGSVMPVWGGETPGGTVNTGAYWDGFGWTPMATAGAPSVRRAHTAVWAPGTGMIVWGGTFGFLAGVRNDGGIYFHHPLFGDNWANTPPAAPIVGRIGHTATWAGNRMIVFGGLTLPLALVGDGAAFNPSNYTWSVLPTANAPSPRYAHTAICPGDDSAVIWGGNPPLANGARYSVSANAWTPIAPVSLEARGNIESIWTGSEMIVWGGQGSAGALANGARYNPNFNGWTPMSSVGAPSARYDYRSRLHGGEMYLWGGTPGTNSGARYCASCTPLESYEVALDLEFTSPTSLAWTASAGVSAYSLYRGTMTSAGAWVYDHGCYQSGLPGPSATEAAVPPDGTGYYYLVGATNGCSRTNLGQRTGGANRPYTSCP